MPTRNVPDAFPHDEVSTDRGRPTRIRVDLDRLRHNLKITRRALGSDTSILVALKANAYGHGAVMCARALEGEGVDWFGVATPDEGLELRRAGIAVPILCLGGFWNGQEELIIRNDLTPALFTVDQVERLDLIAGGMSRKVRYHLKVDTGMGRLGVSGAPLDELLSASARSTNLALDGVMTHFACADDPERRLFTRQQIDRFWSMVDLVRGRGHRPTWFHLANGAGALSYPDAGGNLVRLGGIVYGLWRDTVNPSTPPLDWLPVMSFQSRICLIKEVAAGVPLGYGGAYVTSRPSIIATAPVGYGDGLRRGLSNRGRVLVRGRAVPIVGRISMDLTLIDVTDVGDAAVGDEVVLFGRQADETIEASDMAGLLGTVSYEVTCSIGSRVSVEYIGGPGANRGSERP